MIHYSTSVFLYRRVARPALLRHHLFLKSSSSKLIAILKKKMYIISLLIALANCIREIYHLVNVLYIRDCI